MFCDHGVLHFLVKLFQKFGGVRNVFFLDGLPRRVIEVVVIIVSFNFLMVSEWKSGRFATEVGIQLGGGREASVRVVSEVQRCLDARPFARKSIRQVPQEVRMSGDGWITWYHERKERRR